MEQFALDLSIIIVGSAVLSIGAVFLKQPIIIAYILCGILAGPWGLGWIRHVESIEMISRLGVTLLLFLAGLCLHPQKLLRLFRETIFITAANCAASFVTAFLIARVFHFSAMDALCIGLAFMFSSTILVVKLLPTTRLHHERMGAICIGVLIMQDLLAIVVLAWIRCLGAQGVFSSFTVLTMKLCLFIGALVLVEQHVLRRVMGYVERLHEIIFILGLAWCFGIAGIANRMGLFYETGAFFAGVVMARHPIALFVSERLKPLRDFFLVLFFFTLGAKLDFLVLRGIWLPSLALTLIFVLAKPWLFQRLFMMAGEERAFAQETGTRLGQLSEFSLLIAVLALNLGHISHAVSQLIQAVTILTFIISSYIVVLNYQTPIGVSKQLIKD